MSADVEGFRARVGLDDKAFQSLQALTPEQQLIVVKLVDEQMAQGQCQNPSALTWSKIKAIRQQPIIVKAEFFQQCLDDNSYQALQSLPVRIQEEILNEADMSRCRNPSAVVWSLIKRKGLNGRVPRADSVQTSGIPAMGSVPQQAASDIAAGLALDEGATTMLQSLSEADQQKVLAQINPQACRNPSAVVIKKIIELKKSGFVSGPPSRGPSAGGLGSLAGQLSPSQQSQIMGQLTQLLGGLAPQLLLGGGVAAAGGAGRDRSRTPFGGGVAGLNLGGGPTALSAAQLDQRAQQSLSELSPEEQHIVLSLVQQQRCNNPSAVAWSKVKKIRENPTEIKMEFLSKVIDKNSMEALSKLDASTQAQVLDNVNVTKCRNLSAVVWSQVKRFGGGSPGAPVV